MQRDTRRHPEGRRTRTEAPLDLEEYSVGLEWVQPWEETICEHLNGVLRMQLSAFPPTLGPESQEIRLLIALQTPICSAARTSYPLCVLLSPPCHVGAWHTPALVTSRS